MFATIRYDCVGRLSSAARDEAAMRSTAQDKTAKRVRQRVTFNAPPPETVEAYFRGGGREETEKGREGTGRQPAELRPQWGPMHNDDFRSAVVESEGEMGGLRSAATQPQDNLVHRTATIRYDITAAC